MPFERCSLMLLSCQWRRGNDSVDHGAALTGRMPVASRRLTGMLNCDRQRPRPAAAKSACAPSRGGSGQYCTVRTVLLEDPTTPGYMCDVRQ